MNSRLALLTGLLLPLTFAPLPFGFLAHLSLLPLFFGLYRKEAKTSFRWGFASGIFFYLGLLYWINFLKVEGITLYLLPLGVLLLILYLSLYMGVFCLILSLLQKRFGDFAYLLAPPLWTSLEFLRSLTYLGFPWGTLAYTQTSFIPFIQFADTTGVPGVTFWVVSVNTALFYLIRNSAWGIRMGIVRNRHSALRTWIILLLLFILPLLYGFWVLRRIPETPKILVAVAQLNVPPEIKLLQSIEDRFDILHEVTLQVPKGGAQLMVWPETSVPGFPRYNEKIRQELGNLLKESDIPILMGTTDYIQGEVYNSAMLVVPEEGITQTYEKILLVPFGERFPFDDIIPALRKLELGQGHYSIGKEKTVFQLRSTKHETGSTEILSPRFSTLICFESVFPWLVRSFVHEGAEFLVNITDDSWFGKTSGPFQHAQMTIFRSIENRRALVRCANTGVSMVVDPYGRVLKKTKIFTRKLLLERLPLRRDLTLYTRFGDLFAWLCVGVSLLGFSASAKSKLKRSR